MRLIITVLVFGLLLFGCLEPAPEQNVTNMTNVTPPAVKNPTFAISSPTASEVIYTSGETEDITIILSTQNLVLTQTGDGAIGEGYFKVSVDGSPSTIITSKNYVLPGLAIGEHVIHVELFKTDGKPYGLSKQVTFTIAKETPPEYQPVTYTVEIDGFEYDPESITINRTDSVTFVNVGNYPESATCFLDGKEVFDTDVLGPGASTTLSFDELLSCEYYSVTYSFVKGQITVQPNPTD